MFGLNHMPCPKARNLLPHPTFALKRGKGGAFLSLGSRIQVLKGGFFVAFARKKS